MAARPHYAAIFALSASVDVGMSWYGGRVEGLFDDMICDEPPAAALYNNNVVAAWLSRFIKRSYLYNLSQAMALAPN